MAQSQITDFKELQQTDKSPLCDLCRGINIESISRPNGYQHVPSFKALRNRNNLKECVLCTALIGQLDATGILWKKVDSISTHPSPSQLRQIAGAGGIRLPLDPSPISRIVIVAEDIDTW
jgi:hypothetical protein